MSVNKTHYYCRWCGKAYRATVHKERDGFCSHACKQAHHRAYHKYVTRRRDRRG